MSTRNGDGAGHDEPTLLRRDADLFLVSVLILYLELVLIRWIGTEIRIFAYLGNLILVVCFFGVGLGCYLSAQPVRLSRLGVNLLILVVLVANPLHVGWLDLKRLTTLLSGFEDSPIWEGLKSWNGVEVLSGVAIIAGLLYFLAYVFLPLGQVLGAGLASHPRVIRAYSVNIAGSLAGVWLFDLLSWASSPPPVWMLAAAGLVALWIVAARRQGWVAVGLVGLAAVVVWLGGDRARPTIWSPYQKLAVQPFFSDEETCRVQQGYLMEVNGSFYQLIVDLSDGFLKRHPDLFQAGLADRSDYNLPFRFKPKIRRLLIVGAGTGNNAAAALRHGVEQVDCVEIDPQIYNLGRQLHPEHPYDSPRVRMIVNDARAFFKQAQGPYDMIWFGWLDSHTLGSSYNNLRLDHYVYTLESFREARRLLADDGLLVVNFVAERHWIADRLFGLLEQVFGHEPLAYAAHRLPPRYGANGFTLVCGAQPVTTAVVNDPELRADLEAHRIQLRGTTRATTDDWPYLYLRQARIPRLHLITSLTIIGTVLVVRRRVFGVKRGIDWHFFALGAAFLLLEVQTVSRATLLFGMTWVVNAIVISAVLLMILAANLVAFRWSHVPLRIVVTGLAVTILSLALVPLDWFNVLRGAGKVLAASAFLTAPLFFGGLIFIRSFAGCADKSRALGSNLIGALVGGLLESVSFVTGMRALVVVVGLFYLAALVWRPRPAQE